MIFFIHGDPCFLSIRPFSNPGEIKEFEADIRQWTTIRNYFERNVSTAFQGFFDDWSKKSTSRSNRLFKNSYNKSILLAIDLRLPHRVIAFGTRLLRPCRGPTF
jgi:hypothetical protein